MPNVSKNVLLRGVCPSSPPEPLGGANCSSGPGHLTSPWNPTERGWGCKGCCDDEPTSYVPPPIPPRTVGPVGMSLGDDAESSTAAVSERPPRPPEVVRRRLESDLVVSLLGSGLDRVRGEGIGCPCKSKSKLANATKIKSKVIKAKVIPPQRRCYDR